jgi:anti-sigma factor (TIGR02949 family)
MYSCSECREHIYTFLDRELSEDEQLEVRQHLSLCRDCLDRFRFEGNVLRALGAVGRKVGCPEETKQRVLKAIGKSAI